MYTPSIDSTNVLLANGQAHAPGITAGQQFTNIDRMVDYLEKSTTRSIAPRAIVNGDPDFDDYGTNRRDYWRPVWRVGIDLRDGTTFLY
jgi:hypothetical protein